MYRTKFPGDFVSEQNVLLNYLGYSDVNTLDRTIQVGSTPGSGVLRFGPDPVINATYALQFDAYVDALLPTGPSGANTKEATLEPYDALWTIRNTKANLLIVDDSMMQTMIDEQFDSFQEFIGRLFRIIREGLAEQYASMEEFIAPYNGIIAAADTTRFTIETLTKTYVIDKPSFLPYGLQGIDVKEVYNKGEFKFKNLTPQVHIDSIDLAWVNAKWDDTEGEIGLATAKCTLVAPNWISVADELTTRPDLLTIRSELTTVSGLTADDFHPSPKYPGYFLKLNEERVLNRVLALNAIVYENVTFDDVDGSLFTEWMSTWVDLQKYSVGDNLELSTAMQDFFTDNPSAKIITRYKGDVLKVGEVFKETKFYANCTDAYIDILDELVINTDSTKLTWRQLDNKAKKIGMKKSTIFLLTGNERDFVPVTNDLDYRMWTFSIDLTNPTAVGELVGNSTIPYREPIIVAVTDGSYGHNVLDELLLDGTPIQVHVDTTLYAVLNHFVQQLGYADPDHYKEGLTADYVRLASDKPTEYELSLNKLGYPYMRDMTNDEFLRYIMGSALFENDELRSISAGALGTFYR